MPTEMDPSAYRDGSVKIVLYMSWRQDAQILRSLARTARTPACSSESSGTGGGPRGLPRGLAAARLSAAAAPPPPSAGWDAFVGPPTRASTRINRAQVCSHPVLGALARRWVPPSQTADSSSQAAKMVLIGRCCFQSQFLPQVRTADSDRRDALLTCIYPEIRTADSDRRDALLTCIYPEIFARPSSGTSWEKEKEQF